MSANHEARWYQQEAVQSLFDYFAANPGFDSAGRPVKRNPLVCLPTGTGKSHVIADFIKRAMAVHPQTRVFMATHVKELIRQNANKLQEAWPLAPLGLYSAGLKSRDAFQPIIFGGIQSAVGKFPLFGRRDLLIVDEAHLLGTSNDTSYLKFIGELTGTGEGIPKGSPNVNPYLKVIGLTATRYRMGLGCLTNGNIFTDVAYDLCTIEGFNRLIAEGYLVPPIPKKTKTQLDVSGVGLSNGEFAQGELQAAVDKQDVTYQALLETVNEGANYGSWLIFASGVEHAVHIADMMNNTFGISCGIFHSNTKDYPRTDKQNSEALADWKAGKTRAIVNMNALTTGVDHPACNLIAMLRPTMSTGLWVQMLGRGTRPFAGKTHCKVLDFAGNTRRLGPINDPVIPKLKGQGPPGDAPVRICPQCSTYNHASARICVVCGTEFTFQEKLSAYASNAELIRSDLPQVEPLEVERMVLAPHHSKRSGLGSIKVAYYCKGVIGRTFYEYINVESPTGFVKKKSRDWFRQRFHYSGELLTWGEDDVPATNAEVLALANELRAPVKIRVWINKEMPEILGYEF